MRFEALRTKEVMWAHLLLSGLILYGVTSEILLAQALNNKGYLVDIKCSKCHTLRRVFIMCKSESEWRVTIEKMMNKNQEWIQPAEAEQILKEILISRAERVHAMCQERKDYEDARFLFVDRCTLCHNINRILYQDKTPEEWKETVERMCTEAMGYITSEDSERIARFLLERAEILREDAGSKLFLDKCMNCHPGEQILLETHNRKEWRKILRNCSEIAAKTFKTSWLHPYEVELIVDILVKTQGFSVQNN
ncbi:MAG: hypothetical protein QMD05_10760 [Candidatus Brocadiaceae bacterium]|nr:hypothetical protein [Candidatus Brocadiaceae bacterium]